MRICRRQNITPIEKPVPAQKVITPEEKQKGELVIKMIPLLVGMPHVESLFTTFGGCLLNWVPEMALSTRNILLIMNTVLQLPYFAVRRYLPTKTHFFSYVVVAAPISEEILCRGIIQELFLKRIPVALLQKCNPQAAERWKSHMNAKICRVALSTLLFSIAHLYTESCEVSNRAISTIGIGALNGMLVEIFGIRQGLIKAIFMHAMMNLLSSGVHIAAGGGVDPVFDLLDK